MASGFKGGVEPVLKKCTNYNGLNNWNGFNDSTLFDSYR